MRAIESGDRSAAADRSSRDSAFSASGDDSDAGPRAPRRIGSVAGRDEGSGSDDRHRDADPARPDADAALRNTSARDGEGSDARGDLAHRAPETAFEHPFADGDGHLFDQSTSGPSPRERRKASRQQSPAQRALGLLVRREHSRKELTRKLTSRGLDREQVVEAVDRLAEAGWQDDERFAQTLVRSRANNGYGPMHIRAELGTHGLDGEAIAAAMASFDGDWLENARDLLRRRFGEAYADDPARRRKAADLLMRRGFEMETIRIASRSYPSD
ncbi:recombination regulator RecX [Lysobacter enzymogenes]|nr:recombination regulator RecX [Lysobacter enzymogenes]